MKRRRKQFMMAGEGFAEGVDRRRADVAEHDSDGADHKLGQRSLDMSVALRLLFGSDLCSPRGGNIHS